MANYYINPHDGSDENNGTTAELAFKSLVYAATQVAPSDSLIFVGGDYGPLGVNLDAGQVAQWDGDEFIGMSPTFDFNFTADGDGYIRANEAMTVALGGAIGTGDLTYAKSTNGAPSTFSATTLPATLEAGAFLKVTVANLSGFKAVQLVRTA